MLDTLRKAYLEEYQRVGDGSKCDPGENNNSRNTVEQSNWTAEEIQAAKVQGFELTIVTMVVHLQKKSPRFPDRFHPLRTGGGTK